MARTQVLPRARKALDAFAALATNTDQRRQFRQMWRTRSTNPLELRLPWLPFELIEYLSTRVDGKVIFEYGGGGSTVWLSDHGAQVFTVEHDPDWSDQLNYATRGLDNVQLNLTPLGEDGADYVESISKFPDQHFDIVIVDGRYRARCARAAIPKIRSGGGLLVIDDIDRRKYLDGVGDLSDWRHLRFDGFAPGKLARGHTGVWIAPKLRRDCA